MINVSKVLNPDDIIFVAKLFRVRN